MGNRLREFVAVVWRRDSDEPGKHQTLMAESAQDARSALEEMYGPDIIVSLTDVEAADRPR